MFDVLMAVITALSDGIYRGSDASIGAVCALAWKNYFGPVAGLIIGFAILSAFFREDLVSSFAKFFHVLLPLFIISWLIKPGAGSCRINQLKVDMLAMRADVTSAIAPDFAGPPATLVMKSAARMKEIFADFNKAQIKASKSPTATSTDQKDPLTTPMPVPTTK